MRHRSVLFALVAVIGLVAVACGGGDKKSTDTAAGRTSDTALVGLFRVDQGQCADAGVTAGSSFRMVEVGGKAGVGPYVANADSPCGDKTWNPLKPGTDGGLITGSYQPQAAEPFDAQGKGTTATILAPTPFFAVAFANATNQVDPQTGAKTPAPTITVNDGKLSGDLRAFGAAWNQQHFNQGVPKPDGQRPGLTTGPSGTYDPATKRYVLEWSSQIIGGPFNNFTGVWHLEGIFEAR
jgi:hypothetical protein